MLLLCLLCLSLCCIFLLKINQTMLRQHLHFIRHNFIYKSGLLDIIKQKGQRNVAACLLILKSSLSRPKIINQIISNILIALRSSFHLSARSLNSKGDIRITEIRLTLVLWQRRIVREGSWSQEKHYLVYMRFLCVCV